MIERVFDAELLNRIANAPDVAATFGLPGAGRMDFTEVASRTDDHVILTDRLAVAAVAEWTSPGCWQVHIMAREPARGEWALARFREARDWMFDFGARQLWCQVATESRHTSLVARMVGFRPAGSGVHPVIGPVGYYEVTR